MAVMKRSALGRGLDALITMDDLKTGGSSSISEIELSKIQPNPEQPRSIFEEEALEELKDMRADWKPEKEPNMDEEIELIKKWVKEREDFINE